MGKIIIPVRNEQESIEFVLSELDKLNFVAKQDILIVDNGSTDSTVEIINRLGFHCIFEPRKGYGYACLCALKYIETEKLDPDWILFMDGDGSDFIEDIPHLLEPIIRNEYDLVIGDRISLEQNKGSLGAIQIFGNKLICLLIKIFYFKAFNDLGSLRVIRYKSLKTLQLKDITWGWNIEMQIRALQEKIKILEIPVRYRKRFGGKSKISGSYKMILPVGFKIIFTFFYLLIFSRKNKVVKKKS